MISCAQEWTYKPVEGGRSVTLKKNPFHGRPLRTIETQQAATKVEIGHPRRTLAGFHVLLARTRYGRGQKPGIVASPAVLH